MYHSLNFEFDPASTTNPDPLQYNTLTDFFLVPTSRPTINPPTLKSTSVDIPGANGVLDLTRALVPYPVFSNRQGTVEFAVLNDKMDWAQLYSKIMGIIHGRKMRMWLEDDPDWYYEGTWTVEEWRSNADGTWSNVTLGYDLFPYKLKRTETTLQYSMANTTTIYAWSIMQSSIGIMPISPKIRTTRKNVTVSVTTKPKYSRKFEQIGTYEDPSFVLWAPDRVSIAGLTGQGGGDLYLTFREGSL